MTLALPTPRQLAWHAMELYGFIHFTVNTFTGHEWGYGDESPALFNPTDFDAGQIAAAAKEGGLKGLILTCKHHDGFCLWPSAYTEHSVKNSPWRGGKGDVVAEISRACASAGLRFGVYLSPWDRNRADYATPAYINYYRAQLRELLSNYGEIFEVWFDGANGGDGYYGGARETRKIDAATYYDWENTIRIVRELQPQACIFSDTGPDIRWVGNEDGIAGDPCWSTLNPQEVAPGPEGQRLLNHGTLGGPRWLPAECDVSIRPGWFYHPEEDDRVKTPRQLLDLYFQSVGRGASLLLNLPPDPRGQVHPSDAAALSQFQRDLQALFAHDLARGARVAAAVAANPGHPAAALVDGDARTYWLAEGSEPAEVTITFDQPARFNVLALREHLPLGQRVGAFALDAWQPSGWTQVATAQAIGNLRLLRLPTCQTERLRLRILESAGPCALSTLSLYFDPAR